MSDEGDVLLPHEQRCSAAPPSAACMEGVCKLGSDPITPVPDEYPGDTWDGDWIPLGCFRRRESPSDSRVPPLGALRLPPGRFSLTRD